MASFLLDILTWLSIIVGITIAYLIKQFISKLVSPLNKIPGLPTWSPLGHLLIIMKEPPGDPYLQWSEQHGGIVRYCFPIYSQRVAITDPEYIKHVLVTQCTKYRKPLRTKAFLGDLIGEGLLLLEGQKHAKVRKIINPTFKYNKIKEMAPVFQNFAQLLVNYWQNEIDERGDQKATLNVHQDFARITLDIICKCAFDYDCNSLTNENNQVSVAFRKIIGGLTLNWTYLVPGFKYLPTSSNRERSRALSICHSTVKKVINQKLEKGPIDEEKCLLDILLSLKDEENNPSFTGKELQDQIMTFMAAGHETTSVALTWTLYALASNPELQEKVRKEICKVIQPSDNITWSTFDELPFLENVIKESLRLYPPAPLTFREATADDKLGKYFIPKGTTIAILAPHRSSKYFEEPLKFNPDRWDNSAKNTSPYAYMPFLRGPRICIGSKFALTEMKCILSLLLSNFSFQPYPNQQIERKLHITMRPYPPLKLIVSPVSP
ncbi:Cytochrome P450 4c21 [Trichoplax sp. H2]|nr:Cytochrome P450 4c21 [Trichoplax sp. H2]|eukprot:RDD40334.1 Cytochrome P450 4c21 [Trichoplax sp. H2]